MRKSRIPRRVRLRGWFKWTPFLLAPFIVLMGEVWMNIHMYIYSYEQSYLQDELRESGQNIHALREDVASMEAVDKMRDMALELNLVEPAYEQIQIVRETGTGGVPGSLITEDDYHMARADARPPARQ
jgi:hypothetical protein